MLTVQQIKQVVTDYFKDKPVKNVYLFGSYARGEAKEESDVDLLFSLEENNRLTYFGLAQYLIDLQSILYKKIDFVEDRLVYPRIRKYVDVDKILLFSK